MLFCRGVSSRKAARACTVPAFALVHLRLRGEEGGVGSACIAPELLDAPSQQISGYPSRDPRVSRPSRARRIGPTRRNRARKGTGPPRTATAPPAGVGPGEGMAEGLWIPVTTTRTRQTRLWPCCRLYPAGEREFNTRCKLLIR